MSQPKRIQRKRTKGWRMPAGAVYVGRPTKWGNPFRPKGGKTEALSTVACAYLLPLREPYLSRAAAVLRYAHALGLVKPADLSEILRVAWRDDSVPVTRKEIRAELKGKDLACWCPEGSPCHADVLLKAANE